MDNAPNTPLSRAVRAVHSARNRGVVSGAGLSTDSGVPDFRSSAGVFARAAADLCLRSGRDLFDAQRQNDASVRAAYVNWVRQTRDFHYAYQPYVQQGGLDGVMVPRNLGHALLSKLNVEGRLLCVLTQNIDGLEDRAGFGAITTRLHGDVRRLRCTVCHQRSNLGPAAADGTRFPDVYQACTTCQYASDERVKRGKRALPVGHLRPDVVLYNDPWDEGPDADGIGAAQFEAGETGDLLVVLGTSLTVPGCRALVRDVATRVRRRGGAALFVGHKAPDTGMQRLFTAVVVGSIADFARACGA